jgi:hypothetical protein
VGLEDAFRSELDRHGFGFHHAVVKHIASLRTPWRVEEIEFPIEHRGRPHHIDLILRGEGGQLLIVGECKRANPALVDWCFVRFPNLPFAEFVPLEWLRIDMSNTEVRRVVAGLDVQNARASRQVYNLGVPVKGSLKGDEAGDNKTALDGAVEQVVRCSSGLIAFLGKNPQLLEFERDLAGERIRLVAVVPAVFTTANLWTSDLDLSAADLSTGNVPKASLTRVPWLWLKHNVSPGLTHSIPPPDPDRRETLRDFLLRDYARAVAIVSVGGIAEFLHDGHFREYLAR